MALCALAAVLTAASAGATRSDPADSLVPKQGMQVGRGEEWIYETRDSVTNATLSTVDVVVVEKRADAIAVRMRITDPNTGLTRVGPATFDLFWRRAPDESSPGEGVQESWGVRPNLRVGDDWSYRFERTILGGPIRMAWIGHGEAIGREPVTLPNGQTVDAIKIEFFERPAVARYRFAMHVVEWFAPQVGRYVKREVESRTNGQIAEATTEILLDHIQR